MLILRGWSGQCGALTLVGALGCTSLGGRLERAHEVGCREALEQHPKLTREQGYASEPKRPEYEVFIASCWLETGHAQQALHLTQKLDQREVRSRALALRARAAAALGDLNEAQSALEALEQTGPVEPELFTQSPEFRKYATEDWFVAAALSGWSPDGQVGLEQYLRRVIERGDATLLPLRVAAADAGRGPGQWAVWMGKVSQARLDREADTTLLKAEGLDVQRELVAVDRKVKSVRSSWQTFSRFWGTARKSGPSSASFSGFQTTSITGDTRPEYETEEIYEERFSPNGVAFAIEYPKADERVVQASTVAVVGRYLGRDPNGLPRLRALMVAARAEQQTRERVEGDDQSAP